MIDYDANLKIFTSTFINKAGYFGGFTTRAVGDGRKTTTIQSLLSVTGVELKKIIIPDQIHSANVAHYENSGRELIVKVEETDGVITGDPGVALTVVTADCCPVIFKDEVEGFVGISHVGWRGSFKKMPQKMVAKMEEAGSRPENIVVALGPTIGACCYDIPDDRYEQFMEEYEEYAPQVFQHRGGKWYLSLTLFNYLLLKDVGVKAENIDHFPFCTKCDERFFSFRRDRKGHYGEMFSFVVKSV